MFSLKFLFDVIFSLIRDGDVVLEIECGTNSALMLVYILGRP